MIVWLYSANKVYLLEYITQLYTICIVFAMMWIQLIQLKTVPDPRTYIWVETAATQDDAELYLFLVFSCHTSPEYGLMVGHLLADSPHRDTRSYLCACFQQVESHSVVLTKLYNSARVPPSLCGPWPTAPSLCGLPVASIFPAVPLSRSHIRYAHA